MLRYEIKKITDKRINRLLFAGAFILAVLFAFFAINGVRYIEEDGSVHKGIDAARLLSTQKNEWKGTLTPDVLAKVVENKNELKTKYAGDNGMPDEIYAKTEQAYMDIEELINSMATQEGEYNPYAVESLNSEDAKKLYEIRKNNIDSMIEQETSTPTQQQYLEKLYEKSKTPFYYESAEPWKAMSLLGEEYGLVIVLLIGFLAAGIFADEFQYKADAVFFSTKRGRKEAVHAKIQAGIIITTVVYIICMALFSIICFGVMGTSGASTPIQTEWCYSMYAITYGQYYVIIIVSGYIASILAASLTMMVSAKLHTASIAVSIPFVLFCVSPFLGRALPFHTFFSLTPDQLMNVCNSIKNVVVFQVGGIVFRPITFVMVIYIVLALLLIPITYRFYNRYTIKS